MDLVEPPNRKEADNLLPELIREYSDPSRHYHNLDQLRDCFTMLDEVMAKLPGTGSVELALWYHDFFYDSKASVPFNEETSADLAYLKLTRALGFTVEYGLQVANLILATDHRRAPATREAKVLLDLDLSILSADDRRYDQYELAIRREYGWASDDKYKAGRTKFLRAMLDRQWVYSTPELRGGPWEGRARRNLERALAAL